MTSLDTQCTWQSSFTRVLLGLWAAAVVAGCQTVPTMSEEDHAYFSALPQEQRDAIAEKRVLIGFTPRQVQLAWGEPAYKQVPADNPDGAIWLYTRIAVATHYRVRTINDPATRTYGYVEEPVEVPRELITRTVTFADDRVTTWSIYPGSMRFDKPGKPLRFQAPR